MPLSWADAGRQCRFLFFIFFMGVLFLGLCLCIVLISQLPDPASKSKEPGIPGSRQVLDGLLNTHLGCFSPPHLFLSLLFPLVSIRPNPRPSIFRPDTVYSDDV